MPQASGLVRHNAKHNPPGSQEEPRFFLPPDHILREVGIYLSGASSVSSKFLSEEIFRQKEKDLSEEMQMHAG